jgi:hypothetical protein
MNRWQKLQLKNNLDKERIIFQGLFFRKLRPFFLNQLRINQALLKASSDELAFFIQVDKSKFELELILKECYLSLFTKYKANVPDVDRMIHLTSGRICLNTKKLLQEQFKKKKENILAIFSTSGRVMKIAHTEVNCGLNTAMYWNAYHSGLLHKQWITAGEESGDGRHSKLTGKVIPITERFSNGLLYPGDIMGGIRDVIGCRCFCVYS